ncbi:hypothetical protein [Longimicrobium sp.]|uniref:hypothetical protein n=1 Tax=Longimicrobium sp. TaxID=2029185 RepID=UPI002E354EDD|nr:hypothetical protein [Longimicrobium sp.]HEX6038432.1 hypothetical protein [Longimicrobium sp.]
MQARIIRPLALSALVLAAACESPSGETPVKPEDLRATVLRGDAQQDSAGTRLADTLVVRVTDTRGRPVPDLTVGWTVVTQGGGEPFLATVQTDADGRARNFWNLGTRAGAHAMEVRAILDGQPVVLDSVTATARPGAAVQAAVTGDTVRAMARQQSARVLLSGTDRHGNVIPAGEVTAAWTSSASGVATVGGDGTVTAAAPGRATLTATGSGWTLRVHVSVNGTAQVVNELPSAAYVIGSNGSRTLTGGPQVLRRVNGVWSVEPGAPAANFISRMLVLPSGVAWGMGLDATGRATWRSDAPGSWARVPLPAGEAPDMITSAGGTVFVGALGGAMHRRDGDAWTPLPALPTITRVRQILGMAAASPDELYIGGATQVRFGDGSGQPHLMRWANGAWTTLAIPASVVLAHNTVVTRLAASPDGSTIYALIWSEVTVQNTTVYLLRIAGGVATDVPLPASLRNVRLDGLAVGADGTPYLSGDGRIAWMVNGAWREHVFTDGWASSGTPFVEPSGVILVPAWRMVNGQERSAVLELEDIP